MLPHPQSQRLPGFELAPLHFPFPLRFREHLKSSPPHYNAPPLRCLTLSLPLQATVADMLVSGKL